MKIKLIPDVPTNEIPEGITCRLCGKTAKPGQFVMHERIRNFGHIVWHFDCVQRMVEDAREDLVSIEDEFKRILREETDIYV